MKSINFETWDCTHNVSSHLCHSKFKRLDIIESGPVALLRGGRPALGVTILGWQHLVVWNHNPLFVMKTFFVSFDPYPYFWSSTTFRYYYHKKCHIIKDDIIKGASHEKRWHHKTPPRVPPSLATPLVKLGTTKGILGLWPPNKFFFSKSGFSHLTDLPDIFSVIWIIFRSFSYQSKMNNISLYSIFIKRMPTRNEICKTQS